jgi:hypothetical protein
MPTTSVVVLAVAAPRVGADYGFTDGGRAFAGVVVAIKPLRKAKAHVHVVVELTKREHHRLVEGG